MPLGAAALGLAIQPSRAADEVRISAYMPPIQDELTKVLSENTGTQIKILEEGGAPAPRNRARPLTP